MKYSLITGGVFKAQKVCDPERNLVNSLDQTVSIYFPENLVNMKRGIIRRGQLNFRLKIGPRLFCFMIKNTTVE